MNSRVFEELAIRINQAQRMHGRKPDYVIVGRETLIGMQYHPDGERNMSLERFTVLDIDLVKSEKEHELEIAYKA